MAVFEDGCFAAEFLAIFECCGDAEVGCIVDGSYELEIGDVG